MKVTKIEILNNEFIEHLSKVLNELFIGPLKISFKVEYFLGEDNKGNKGLYFEISSSIAEVIYDKSVSLKPFETRMDVEESFFDQIMIDLILAGVSFINIEKIKSLNKLPKLKDKGNVIKHVIYLN